VRAAAFALAAIACVAPGLSCGGNEATARARPAIDAEPRWEDVLDAPPELLAIVFPTALRTDKVYGPLLRRAIDLVREQSRVVAETRALDAMEDAEEVIIGIRPDAASGAAGEVVVVVRGVRADVDPATLVDADGHPLWAPGPGGRVRELVRTASASSDPPAPVRTASASSDPPAPSAPVDSPAAASLFELPGRTWLIASGNARERARAVFARPLGRPGMRLERFDPDGAETLILLRIDGPSLVARVRALRPGPDGRAPPGALGTLGRHLEALTLELAAGSSAPDASPDAEPHRTIRASLSYTEPDAAAQAEATARDVIGAIARKKPDDLAWLASASVDRPPQGAALGTSARTSGTSVVITAPLPSHLVGALLHAGAARLDAPPPSP
jgi:hypothetical protein